MSLIRNNEIYVKLCAGEAFGSYDGDDEWDEICFGKVKQILVTHGDAINSIQIGYDFNSSFVLGHRHGGNGDKFDCIVMDWWEVPKVVSGFYGPTRGNNATVVTSLTIQTKRDTYGPFGREQGTPFCFNIPSGLSFGGFHGRCNSSYLSAIGVYLKTEAKYHFLPTPKRNIGLPMMCAAAEQKR